VGCSGQALAAFRETVSGTLAAGLGMNRKSDRIANANRAQLTRRSSAISSLTLQTLLYF
jgi:hypothetical protein